jgi:hypothetical protein
MLISIPTGTSTIFGAFQAIFISPRLRRDCATKQSYVRRLNRASLRCLPLADAAAEVNGRGRRSTKFTAARHRVAAIRLDIQRLPFDNRNRRRIDIAFPNGGRGAR